MKKDVRMEIEIKIKGIITNENNVRLTNEFFKDLRELEDAVLDRIQRCSSNPLTFAFSVVILKELDTIWSKLDELTNLKDEKFITDSVDKLYPIVYTHSINLRAAEATDKKLGKIIKES